MTEKKPEIHTTLTIRRALVLFGIALALLALFADRIGTGRSYSGLGTFQILLTLIGLVIAAIGVLGRRIINLYRTTSILLLNTLLFIICLELGLRISNVAAQRLDVSGSQPTPYLYSNSRRAALPYYAAQEWSQQYWTEYGEITLNYYPYGVWRSQPFDGETINIDSRGIRVTPDTDCGSNSFTIFLLGGSAIWGVGAPDWGTIPAYLQTGLEAIRNEAVCIVNLADLEYTSSQEVVILTTELQLGHIPDEVIFYDGVNDIGVALQNGDQPWIHGNYQSTVSRFQSTRSNPLIDWLETFQLYQAVARTLPQRARQQQVVTSLPEINYDNAADGIVQTYLNNYDIVDALGRSYGFDYYFFWQPFISIGNKPLSIDEQTMRAEITPEDADLFDTIYQRILETRATHNRLFYLADALDGQEEQTYIDMVHITPVGNQVMANAILNILSA